MPVYLHLLYAGRGDSMIIEDRPDLPSTEPPKFYMLDGGPLGRNHGQTTGAPYYMFLAAYAKMVSDSVRGKRNFIDPDAIIISHPHDDHYGGLIEMMELALPAQWIDPKAPGKAAMVFNGPLLLPKTVSKEFTRIDKFLVKTKSFVAQDSGAAPSRTSS